MTLDYLSKKTINLAQMVLEYEASCDEQILQKNVARTRNRNMLEQLATGAIVSLDPNRTQHIYPLRQRKEYIFPSVYETLIVLWTEQYYTTQLCEIDKKIKLPPVTYIIPLPAGEQGYKTVNGGWVNGIYKWPPEYFLHIKNPETRKWIKHHYEGR